jgi:Recombinase zinc beta ribbon domain
VLLPDRLPAYISVEQWRANLARLAANRAASDTLGAVRHGPALLAGLVACGRCRRRMGVRYRRRPVGGGAAHAYVCGSAASDYAQPSCQHLAGPCLDGYVTAAVLDAIAPAALEVSLHAAGQVESERAELDRLWRQRLERAAYHADRTRRQYQLAEPENRLVARQLERDREAALATQAQLCTDYERFTRTRPVTLSAAERDAIRALSGDIPALWHTATTTDADRKQIIRCVIERITVAVVDDSENVDVTITWAGGHQTHGQLSRPVGKLEQLSYYPRLVGLVTDLAAAGHTPAQIAAAVNTEGLRPPKRTDRFTAASIQGLMRRLGIRPARPRYRTDHLTVGEHEWRLPDLARELGMPTASLYHWVYRGWVTGRRDPDHPVGLEYSVMRCHQGEFR